MSNDTEQDSVPALSTPATAAPSAADLTDSAKALARKRIEKRRGLQGGVVAYVVVNAGLVAIWAVTGGGYFWPGWILALWGIGMVLGIWDYLRRPITEAQVEAEARRMEHRWRG